MTAIAADKHEPALEVGRLSLNDCRTVCRSLKLRAAELRKLTKKLKEMDRHTEAVSLEREAQDIVERLGPRFDEQGNFQFGPGPNEKSAKKLKKGARDEAEVQRDRIARGGR